MKRSEKKVGRRKAPLKKCYPDHHEPDFFFSSAFNQVNVWYAARWGRRALKLSWIFRATMVLSNARIFRKESRTRGGVVAILLLFDLFYVVQLTLQRDHKRWSWFFNLAIFFIFIIIAFRFCQMTLVILFSRNFLIFFQRFPPALAAGTTLAQLSPHHETISCIDLCFSFGQSQNFVVRHSGLIKHSIKDEYDCWLKKFEA